MCFCVVIYKEIEKLVHTYLFSLTFGAIICTFVLNRLLKVNQIKPLNSICRHRVNDEMPNSEADMRELQSATDRAM